jgi:hypothetical protein
MHSFIVVDYQDNNYKGKLSLEFRKEGYLMRFDERIFEKRYQYYEYVTIKTK